MFGDSRSIVHLQRAAEVIWSNLNPKLLLVGQRKKRRWFSNRNQGNDSGFSAKISQKTGRWCWLGATPTLGSRQVREAVWPAAKTLRPDLNGEAVSQSAPQVWSLWTFFLTQVWLSKHLICPCMFQVCCPELGLLNHSGPPPLSTRSRPKGAEAAPCWFEPGRHCPPPPAWMTW